MMRRATALALAAALVGGLLAIPGSPAGAQNGDGMLDAPRLGFEIDPNAGHVGDTVGAQVDPADVEEHCVTTVEELEAQFFDPPEDPVPGYEQPWNYPGPVFADWLEEGPLVGIEPLDPWPSQSLPPPFPTAPDDPPAGVSPLGWAWRNGFNAHGNPSPATYAGQYQMEFRTNYEQLAALVLYGFLNGLGGTESSISADMQNAYLPATFILTFVDPRTQELVGDTGSFDPSTGVGALEVPELQGGLWAVAAACVEPVVSEESFWSAINTGAVWLEDNEIPLNANISVHGGQGYLFEQVVPLMLAELMQPAALGIDFYCILNDDGFCATPPDPVGLLEELSDEELAEFADLQAGDDAGEGDAGPAGLSAEPVSAAPAFTG